jgi:hypothetical protein
MNEFPSLMSDKSNEKFEKYMAETTSALTAVTKARNPRNNQNKEKTTCPHCKAEDLHKADNCWELDKT